MNPKSIEQHQQRLTQEKQKEDIKYSDVRNKHFNKTSEGSKGKIMLDSFELTQVIGKGSFGKVVLVRKKDTGVLYAMKILNKQNIIKRKQGMFICSSLNTHIFDTYLCTYLCT